jgi:predicted P-loop ATPase
VREYLHGLTWDGTSRLDNWLTTCFGAEHKIATKAMGRKALISAVARTMRPGCKVDHVLILEGPEGVGKSSVIEALCPDPRWFSDQLGEMGTPDSKRNMRGFWLIELAELSSIRSAKDIEHVKAFVTIREDKFVDKWKVHQTRLLRQCIFIGTTNSSEYLISDTGNRRWWPVKCPNLANVGAVILDRDQLWAEAVSAFQAGEPWHFTQAEESIMAEVVEEQEMRRPVDDPWHELARDYMERRLEAVREYATTTTRHAWTVELYPTITAHHLMSEPTVTGVPLVEPGRQTMREARRITAEWRKAGYENFQIKLSGKVLHSWRARLEYT